MDGEREFRGSIPKGVSETLRKACIDIGLSNGNFGNVNTIPIM